jgi:hypothetical protein
LANLVLRGVSTDEQRKTVAALRAEIQQFEQSISSRSSEFRGVQRTTLADVQAGVAGGTPCCSSSSRTGRF